MRLGFLEVLDIGVEVDGDHVKDLPLRFLDDVFGLAGVGVDVLVFPLLDHAGSLLGIPVQKMAAHLILGDVEQLPQIGELLHFDGAVFFHFLQQLRAQIGGEPVARRMDARRQFAQREASFGAQIQAALDFDIPFDDRKGHFMAAAVFGREGRQRIGGPCVFEDGGVYGVAIVRESHLRILLQVQGEELIQLRDGLGAVERGLLRYQVGECGRRSGSAAGARRLVRDGEPAFVVARADNFVFRQRAVSEIRGVPLGALAQGEGAEASLALSAVKDALLPLRLVIVLFPGAAQMTEALLRIRHCDAESVVDDLDAVETAEPVAVQAHIHDGGVCIHAVPDQLRNTQHRLLRLGEPVNMVLGDLYSEGLHGTRFLVRCSEHHNYFPVMPAFGRSLIG